MRSLVSIFGAQFVSVFVSVFVTLVVSLVGCSQQTKAPLERAHVALPPGTAECAACSMVVREQPAPRGQALYRDGTRKYFCSLADLMQGLRAPSAVGAPIAIFVETLDARTDPRKTSFAPRPWAVVGSGGDRSRGEVAFVVGIPRAGVMGAPALAYTTRAEAERVAKAHAGRVVDFAGLPAALLATKPAHAAH